MMKLKKNFETKRIEISRKVFKRVFDNYLENQKLSFRNLNVEKLKKELIEIRKVSIENLGRFKKLAIANLKKQNVKVYEAKNAKEARKILLKIIPKGEMIVKAKSNTLNEIEFSKFFGKRNKIFETDCGDFIVRICEEDPSHPILPALHLSAEKIVENIRKKFKKKIGKKPEEIARFVRNYLREKILKSRFGISGANAISSDGHIVILENEGNISLVSKIPENHIIVAGIDKIVPTLKDAILICQALSLWSVGSVSSYINVISSPSKTADIENKLIYGMHGPKNVYLILLDNGRSKMLKEILYCINCGACLYFCPVYRQIFDYYGLKYFGGIGISKSSFIFGIKEVVENGLFYCTTCKICKEVCPLEIDVAEIIKKVRKIAIEKRMETRSMKEMVKNVKKIGNPFGKIKEGQIPKKLYCC